MKAENGKRIILSSCAFHYPFSIFSYQLELTFAVNWHAVWLGVTVSVAVFVHLVAE